MSQSSWIHSGGSVEADLLREEEGEMRHALEAECPRTRRRCGRRESPRRSREHPRRTAARSSRRSGTRAKTAPPRRTEPGRCGTRDRWSRPSRGFARGGPRRREASARGRPERRGTRPRARLPFPTMRDRAEVEPPIGDRGRRTSEHRARERHGGGRRSTRESSRRSRSERATRKRVRRSKSRRVSHGHEKARGEGDGVQQQVLDEKLPRDAGAGRAERPSQGQLGLPVLQSPPASARRRSSTAMRKTIATTPSTTPR